MQVSSKQPCELYVFFFSRNQLFLHVCLLVCEKLDTKYLLEDICFFYLTVFGTVVTKADFFNLIKRCDSLHNLYRKVNNDDNFFRKRDLPDWDFRVSLSFLVFKILVFRILTFRILVFRAQFNVTFLNHYLCFQCVYILFFVIIFNLNQGIYNP